jgi:S-formylglutathione hydrolase
MERPEIKMKFFMMRLQILRSMTPVLGVVAVLLGGCHPAPQSQPDRPRLTPGATMQDVTFFSAALKREMPYRVFLPVNLVPGRKLPVVYLLHGAGGNFRDWSNYSDVARYAALDVILVMPEGSSSYYTNAALKPEDKYEDYLVNDVISDVEARFPAARNRESRAIIGVSMGGFAAVKLALSRPELFVFAGAISPAIDVPSRRFSLRRTEQSLRFRTIFGLDQSPSRKASDPFVLIRSADPATTPYLFLTAGEQEPLLEPNRRFVTRLQGRHFSYEFHTKPGGHDWTEWNTQIPACFESLLQHLPRTK